MNIYEMEGFLRGKCLPGDMKVNESNAQYLVRKFSEFESKLSESQREFRDYKDRADSNQMRLAKDVCRLEDELQAAGIGVKGE
ncbi:TPA: hypothetical protein ACW47E_004456 [Salmonella enterica subsp. enterica serovar Nagoya]